MGCVTFSWSKATYKPYYDLLVYFWSTCPGTNFLRSWRYHKQMLSNFRIEICVHTRKISRHSKENWEETRHWLIVSPYNSRVSRILQNWSVSKIVGRDEAKCTSCFANCNINFTFLGSTEQLTNLLKIKIRLQLDDGIYAAGKLFWIMMHFWKCW